jgi:menaquinol-cytochrome c reductase cytochrome b/c subunit
MTEIPESLLRRSAEAKAKALGLPVEQVLAEMKGEAPPTPPPSAEPEPEAKAEETVAEEMEESAERSEEIEEAVEAVDDEPAPAEEVAAEPAAETETEVVAETEADVPPAPPTETPDVVVEDPPSPASPVLPPAGGETGDGGGVSPAGGETGVSSPEGGGGAEGDGGGTPADDVPETEVEPAAAAVTTAVEDRPAPEGDGAGSGNGAGNGKVAAVVSTRPTVPPKGTPEGVRTQRLLTVVKARAIQTVKAEPTDKVNTWPHLMLMEFGALLAITGLVVIMSVVIHSPLLDPANFNATPNPSKAPWYFLGLQELLSYFDPQIAGVTVPTITGLIGFWLIPYVDKNPSTRPSDRKFAIALYSVFLAGAATLTIFGVLFRGLGFNFSYPWKDGVYFDDLKDWVQFE